MLITLPPLCVFVLFGQWIIDLLYEPGYSGAGWMLQLLAAGGIGGVINMTMLPTLLAVGDSKRHTLYTVVLCASIAGGMLVGGAVGGVVGVVAGIATSSAVCYPVLAWCVSRYRVWAPTLDLAALVLCNSVIWIGCLII
jgi:O-antigen/teichoic acid export membrane protein